MNHSLLDVITSSSAVDDRVKLCFAVLSHCCNKSHTSVYNCPGCNEAAPQNNTVIKESDRRSSLFKHALLYNPIRLFTE